MVSMCLRILIALACLLFAPAPRAWADAFTFSTGNVTNLMAMASRPDSPGKIEIEAADDFVTTAQTTFIDSLTFTGLLRGGATSDIADITIEIYRVFPNDSDAGRTPNVPTRANSPSDFAFDSRSTPGGLTFTTNTLVASFTAQNSVLNGIFPKPNQTTGGDQAVTGTEVQLNVTLTTPFSLPADHYFFVPQVQMNNGDFFWLSGTRPIVAPGTPFPPGFTDLQAWIRNANLEPDWLRVGTDIVGGRPLRRSTGPSR
jgi:hypothetical protein